VGVHLRQHLSALGFQFAHPLTPANRMRLRPAFWRWDYLLHELAEFYTEFIRVHHVDLIWFAVHVFRASFGG
jgi:hypothetical protein